LKDSRPPFHTIDNFNLEGKKVLLRVDINSPIDPNSGKITDDTRIKSHAETIRQILDRGASVAILAHQGRPGDSDFTTLAPHHPLLCKYVKSDIRYLEDLFGPCAKSAISSMKPGDALLLENVRFYSEENIEKLPEAQSKTFLVKLLSPLFDLYVNDAFATAHRSHPSLVGFPVVMPSAGGSLLEKEVEFLGSVSAGSSRSCLFILGGGKVPDSVQLMETLLPKGIADKILLTGLVSHLFLIAAGKHLGKSTVKIMEGKGLNSLLPRAENLLRRYWDRIMMPVDVAVLSKDGRLEMPLDMVDDGSPIYDIGSDTMKLYGDAIMGAKTVIMRGPAGYIEDARFTKGSEVLLTALVNSKAKTLLGGGHLRSISENLGIADRIGYFSTGGGAFITYLSGEKMPALEVLITSAKKFKSDR
jgi:phosphoglycerate kinase